MSEKQDNKIPKEFAKGVIKELTKDADLLHERAERFRKKHQGIALEDLYNEKEQEFLEGYEKKDLPLGNNETKDWKFYSAEDIVKTEFKDPPFIIDGLIPIDGCSFLVANPSSYKSWIMLHMAVCMALGRPLFKDEDGNEHFATKQKNVLWVDEEITNREIQRRFKKILPEGVNAKDVPITFLSMAGFKLNKKEHRDKIVQKIKEKAINFAFFDNLRQIHDLNENPSEDAVKIFDWLKSLGIPHMATRHRKKEGELKLDARQMMISSVHFWAGANSIIGITNTLDLGFGDIQIEFQHLKLKEGEEQKPFNVFLKENSDKITFTWGKQEEKGIETKAVEIIKEVLSNEPFEYSFYTEILSLVKSKGISRTTIKRAYDGLRKAGFIVEMDKEKASVEKTTRGLGNVVLLEWKDKPVIPTDVFGNRKDLN